MTYYKNAILFLVMIIMAEVMVFPWLAFSGGPGPQELHATSEMPVGEKVDESFVTCPQPRPQMCTMDYSPVCAQLEGGGFKSYSNGCTSCSDSKVIGYREGVCAEEK